MKLQSYVVLLIAIVLALPLGAQNVGINTNSPAAPLHVGSSGQVLTPGGLTLLGHPSEGHMELDFSRIQSLYGNNPLGLSLQDDGGALGVGMVPSTYGPKLQLQHNSWQFEIRNDEDGTLNNWFIGVSNDSWVSGDDKLVIGPTSTSSDASIQMDAGGDVLLVPHELGAVGIGVISTNYMPDGFLLAVDGKAIFEEARVQMSGDWPDYVFHNDYQLQPLGLLEKEIQTLGHLPGIPSAQVVESEGFDLGEMQRRMLEKIEELTLYMIQANREIAELKAANAGLVKHINSLK